jgi:hypothetical protein
LDTPSSRTSGRRLKRSVITITGTHVRGGRFEMRKFVCVLVAFWVIHRGCFVRIFSSCTRFYTCAQPLAPIDRWGGALSLVIIIRGIALLNRRSCWAVATLTKPGGGPWLSTDSMIHFESPHPDTQTNPLYFHGQSITGMKLLGAKSESGGAGPDKRACLSACVPVCLWMRACSRRSRGPQRLVTKSRPDPIPQKHPHIHPPHAYTQ